MIKYNNKDLTKIRTRDWRLVSYLPLDDALQVCYELVNSNYVKHFALALHDKDKREVDGVLVDDRPHVHVLLNLYNARFLHEVSSKFCDISKNAGNCLGLPIDDKVKRFRYLWHADDPDKYQYDRSIVYTNDIDFWNKPSLENNAFDIVTDLLNDTPYFVMLQRYGRDFAIHFDCYRKLAANIYYEQLNGYKYTNSDLSIKL